MEGEDRQRHETSACRRRNKDPALVNARILAGPPEQEHTVGGIVEPEKKAQPNGQDEKRSQLARRMGDHFNGGHGTPASIPDPSTGRQHLVGIDGQYPETIQIRSRLHHVGVAGGSLNPGLSRANGFHRPTR